MSPPMVTFNEKRQAILSIEQKQWWRPVQAQKGTACGPWATLAPKERRAQEPHALLCLEPPCKQGLLLSEFRAAHTWTLG